MSFSYEADDSFTFQTDTDPAACEAAQGMEVKDLGNGLMHVSREKVGGPLCAGAAA